jgi:hypothetical protein
MTGSFSCVQREYDSIDIGLDAAYLRSSDSNAQFPS